MFHSQTGDACNISLVSKPLQQVWSYALLLMSHFSIQLGSPITEVKLGLTMVLEPKNEKLWKTALRPDLISFVDNPN